MEGGNVRVSDREATMKNTLIIKKNYEFKNFFSKGKFFYGESIHMYIHKTNSLINKLGIAVSKKNGKAVQRNRIKRLIRENYKNFEERIGLGNNIVIIVNKNKRIEDINFYSVQKDFERIFEKAGVLKNEKTINKPY